jgi:hypothetical protein
MFIGYGRNGERRRKTHRNAKRTTGVRRAANISPLAVRLPPFIWLPSPVTRGFVDGKCHWEQNGRVITALTPTLPVLAQLNYA